LARACRACELRHVIQRTHCVLIDDHIDPEGAYAGNELELSDELVEWSAAETLIGPANAVHRDTDEVDAASHPSCHLLVDAMAVRREGHS
jgi:hypothetical protein